MIASFFIDPIICDVKNGLGYAAMGVMSLIG